jgi:integral membrane protein
MVSQFRIVAIAEAVTYLALLAAVVLYRLLDGPDLIGFLGPVHGIVFLVYLALTLAIRENQGWSLGQTILVIVAAAVPAGAFVVERRLVVTDAASRG